MKNILLTLSLILSLSGFAQQQKIIIDSSGREVIRNIVPPSSPSYSATLKRGGERGFRSFCSGRIGP